MLTDIRIVIHTTKGDIDATLFPSKAPVTAANFLNLASLGPEHAKKLDGSYSIFGQVTKGFDVTKKIAQRDKIQSIDVVDSTEALFAAQEARLKEWNKILDKKLGNRLAPPPAG